MLDLVVTHWFRLVSALIGGSAGLKAAERTAETKAAEEARRAAEAKAAEDARRAAEAKAAEDARRAAEAKAAEEARRAVEAKAAKVVRGGAKAKADAAAKKRNNAVAAGTCPQGDTVKIKLLFAVTLALSLSAVQTNSQTTMAVEPMDHTPTFRVTVVSRSVDPEQTAVVTVGRITGGAGSAIVA